MPFVGAYAYLHFFRVICLSMKKLNELKRRISEHFYNEARSMKDILKAELTQKETDELVRFMEKHPFSRIVTQLTDVSSQQADGN